MSATVDIMDARRDRFIEHLAVAVEAAIDACVPPNEFVRAAWESWEACLQVRQATTGCAFRRLLERETFPVKGTA